MALPQDFWKNDQSLNIFRTKKCNRLEKETVCGWRSQCQYCHDLKMPRRQYKRQPYRPELCPHIRTVEDPDGGANRVEDNCPAGKNCPWAHSKDEVLFHPMLFKTTLCEEYMTNLENNSGKKKNRNAKKNDGCHRYYCPFAHGQEELRPTTLTQEQRQHCLHRMEILPSDVCCSACTQSWSTPAAMPAASKANVPPPPLPHPASFGMPGIPPLFWGAKSPPGLDHVLSTVPNSMPSTTGGGPGQNLSKDFFTPKKPAKDPAMDAFALPVHNESPSSLFSAQPLTSLSLNLPSESPAFIDLASPAFIDFTSAGCTIGQRPSTKSQPEPVKDLLKEKMDHYYYAML